MYIFKDVDNIYIYIYINLQVSVDTCGCGMPSVNCGLTGNFHAELLVRLLRTDTDSVTTRRRRVGVRYKYKICIGLIQPGNFSTIRSMPIFVT